MLTSSRARKCPKVSVVISLLLKRQPRVLADSLRVVDGTFLGDVMSSHSLRMLGARGGSEQPLLCLADILPQPSQSLPTAVVAHRLLLVLCCCIVKSIELAAPLLFFQGPFKITSLLEEIFFLSMQYKLLLLWCLVVLNLGLQHSSTVEAPSHCSLS